MKNKILVPIILSSFLTSFNLNSEEIKYDKTNLKDILSNIYYKVEQNCRNMNCIIDYSNREYFLSTNQDKLVLTDRLEKEKKIIFSKYEDGFKVNHNLERDLTNDAKTILWDVYAHMSRLTLRP